MCGRRKIMNQKKKLTIINCLASAFIVYFITVPGHELLHVLTSLIYGEKILFYSALCVDSVPADYASMSAFDRIMVTGGSASILNAIFGIILLIILLKKQLKPMSRLFLTQLMGAQLVQGFGYFLIGGLFSVGDWNNVFTSLADNPGVVSALRIILSVIGAGSIVALFFILNRMSYYFIENKEDKQERVSVGFNLHLTILFVGVIVNTIATFLSPAIKMGHSSYGTFLLFNFMWIPFLWGFLFTGPMKTLPPKENLFLFHLPEKPNWILFCIGAVLILVDIFVFGPGIFF